MQTKEKISYEVDPHNRLIVKRTGKPSNITRFRHILDGRFQITEDNSLVYHIKKSAGIDTPQQVRLSGNYSLDHDHNLVFTLNKWNNQVEGNRLIIKSELLDARDNELSFSVGTKDRKGKGKVYILSLSGAWQADENNRLSFEVKKEGNKTDKLILEAAWEINEQNQIIYNTGDNTLIFKGNWNITDKDRIAYVLNKEIGSFFDFEVSIERPEANSLKYQIGIGFKPEKKQLVIFGKWKIDKNLGLLFEVEYEKGNRKAITFGGVCSFDTGKTLEIKLKNAKQKDLGMDLKLSKSILSGQGEAFIQALASRKKLEFLSGAGFRW